MTIVDCLEEGDDSGVWKRGVVRGPEPKAELRALFEEDRAAGIAGTWLPEALARKHPGFPNTNRAADGCTGHPQHLDRPVSRAS